MSLIGDLTGIHIQVPGLRQLGGLVDSGVNKLKQQQTGGQPNFGPPTSKMPMAPLAGIGGDFAPPTPNGFIPVQSVPAEAAAPSKGKSLMGKLGGALGDYFTDGNGNVDLGHVLGVLGTGAAIIGQEQTNRAQNKYQQQQLAIRNKMLNAAQADYDSRAQLRSDALAKLSALLQKKPASDVYTGFLANEQNAAG